MTGIGWAAAAVLAGALGGAARAETVEAAWDSYLYAAPRSNARVIDEVTRRAKLSVLETCADGWCRVRYGEADGYVREIVVRGPGNAVEVGKVTADSACFHAAQPGGNAWQDERFCGAK